MLGCDNTRYSFRKAVVGSRDDARQAGTQQAIAAMAKKSAAMAA